MMSGVHDFSPHRPKREGNNNAYMPIKPSTIQPTYEKNVHYELAAKILAFSACAFSKWDLNRFASMLVGCEGDYSRNFQSGWRGSRRWRCLRLRRRRRYTPSFD